MRFFTVLCLMVSTLVQSQIELVFDTPWRNIKANNKFIFAKYDAVHGREIWATDATQDGAQILFDIAPGTLGSNPNYLTSIDDVVYFQANENQIWRTDGTPGGTYAMVTQGLNDPRDFTKVGNFILFTSGQYNNRKLFRMLDTPLSHTQLSTVAMTDVRQPTVLNGSTVFVNVKVGTTWEIWRTNGNTMQFVADIDPGNTPVPQMANSIVYNGELYFNGLSTAQGWELWKSDGTTPGTVLIADIQGNQGGNVNCANCSSPTYFAVMGGALYFAATNSASGGRELYKLQGSAVEKVKEINTGGDAFPTHLTAYGNQLFFLARQNQFDEIWVTDGTEAGTVKLTENSSGQTLLGLGSILNKLTVFDNHLIFNQTSPENGHEVWKLNLETGVSSLIQDFNPGTAGFFTFDFFEHEGSVYFSGQLEGDGAERMYRLSGSLGRERFADDFQIYPNPTSGMVHISLPEPESYEITVHDLAGRQVLYVASVDGTIDLTGLDAGVYLLTASHQHKKASLVRKIVRQ